MPGSPSISRKAHSMQMRCASRRNSSLSSRVSLSIVHTCLAKPLRRIAWRRNKTKCQCVDPATGDMTAIYVDYLNALDIDALAMSDEEILAAIEAALVAQGNGQTVIEPRVHLEPDPSFRGHFNVLRGYVAPLDAAGVKIVGEDRKSVV